MTIEQKTHYKKLARQVGEAALKIRIKPNLYTNRLQRIKEFLSTLDGDFSSNRFMKM